MKPCRYRVIAHMITPIFLVSIFFILTIGIAFAGIESDIIPQACYVDDFEDASVSTNYIHYLGSDNQLYEFYYSTGSGGLSYPEVPDPENPSNRVVMITWDATDPQYAYGQWWYTNTWDYGNEDTVTDVTYYSHITFKLKGAQGGEDFKIELQELGGALQDGSITDFIDAVTTEWQEVCIPLSYFRGDGTLENPGIDLTKVQAIAFTFYDVPTSLTGTIYIDDIHFSGCVIDDFEDSLFGSNKLKEDTGCGGEGLIESSDQPDGSHKVTWNYPGSGDFPYWHTATNFNSEYACLNPNYYNYLYFKVKGALGGENFRIDYHTNYNFVSIDSKNYMTVTNNWQEVYIPLKHFTDQYVLRRQLNAVAFAFGDTGYTQNGTIYIDDIELKYVKHDPVFRAEPVYYKDYIRGFRIAFDVDDDTLLCWSDNLPSGATLDQKGGYFLWKPSSTGTYPVDLYVQEKRKHAAIVHKQATIVVEDYTGDVKPQSTGPVKIEDRQLLVNFDGDSQYVPYKIKGVGYQPVPIGEGPPPPPSSLPSGHWYRDINLFNRDFELLSEMGANTIRTWGEPSEELLIRAYEYGIRVCAGYWIDYDKDPRDAETRANLKTGFREMVARIMAYGDPRASGAILLWAIGNENNYHVLQERKEWYSLINEMAQEAYIEEGATYHPVAVVNGNFHNISDIDMCADDAQLPYLDIWGSNLYPGYSFSGLFDRFVQLSDKPLWVAEYGIDAFYTLEAVYGDPYNLVVTGYVDEELHEEWNANCTAELLVSDVALGGTIMAYSDEWWKAGDLWQQDPGGFPHGPENGSDIQPDNFANEEYWGIVSISADGPDPDTLDDVTPRPIYYKLKEIFNNWPFSLVRPGDSIQAVIDTSSRDVVYVQEGVYDQDNIIDVKDSKSIIGLEDAQGTIVKGNLIFKESDGEANNLTVLYHEGEYKDFQNTEYSTGLNFIADAGITAINSNMKVKNCIIKPDPDIFVDVRYGKNIQIWNMYNSPAITVNIENNLMLNADAAILLFSQASGGEIGGTIQNNTLDNSTYGIIERMHKENPAIQSNIITNAQDAVHITYDDALDLRLGSISNNDLYSNVHNIWCDMLPSGYQNILLDDPRLGAGNISEDPLYTDPPHDYTPLNPNCDDKGYR